MVYQVKTHCSRGHDFNISRKFHPNGDAYCSECKTIRQKEYRKKYPDRVKGYYKTCNRRRNYGLEPEEYQKLLDDSDNLCMICRTNSGLKSLHIDHNHETGKVRGLLCHHCNTGLGLFKEDINLLLKAIEYLKEG
jgi:hypothetical protein